MPTEWHGCRHGVEPTCICHHNAAMIAVGAAIHRAQNDPERGMARSRGDTSRAFISAQHAAADRTTLAQEEDMRGVWGGEPLGRLWEETGKTGRTLGGEVEKGTRGTGRLIPGASGVRA